MNKVKIAVGIIIAGLLACGIIAGAKEIRDSITFKDEKEVVTEAIAGFFEREDETALEEVFGTKKLEESMKEKGVDTEVAFQLNSIGDSELSMLEGLSASIHAQSDVKERQSAVDIKGTYAGASADISVYADKEKLQLGSSLLDGKVLEMAFSGDLYEKLKSSPLFASFVEGYEGSAGEDSLKEGIEEFQDLLQGKNTEDDSAVFKDEKEEIEKSLEEFKEDMKVSKAEKKTFEINGKDKKCQGYDVEISADAVANLAEDMITVLDKVYQKNGWYKKYMQAFANGYAGNDYSNGISDDILGDDYLDDTYEDDYSSDILGDSDFGNAGGIADYEEMLTQMKEEVMTAIKENIETVDMAVYVTHYGELVSLEVSTTVDEMEYAVEIECHGGEAMYSNMEVKLTMKEEGQEAGISFEVTEEKDGSEITNELVLKAGQGGLFVEVGSAEVVYDTKSSEITGEIKAGKMLADVSLTLEGEVKELKKGSVLDISFDSIKAQASGQVLVDCSMDYAMRSVDKVAELDGNVMDAFAMSEDDWTSLINTVTEKMQALGMSDIY